MAVGVVAEVAAWVGWYAVVVGGAGASLRRLGPPLPLPLPPFFCLPPRSTLSPFPFLTPPPFPPLNGDEAAIGRGVVVVVVARDVPASEDKGDGESGGGGVVPPRPPLLPRFDGLAFSAFTRFFCTTLSPTPLVGIGGVATALTPPTTAPALRGLAGFTMAGSVP